MREILARYYKDPDLNFSFGDTRAVVRARAVVRRLSGENPPAASSRS